MRKRIPIALLLLAAAMHAQQCQSNPDLQGACFRVRGRLRVYNGNPTFRIWPLGTRRLLGVTGAKPGQEPILPKDLGVTSDHDIYGDFLVCPFTARRPGVMQRVCIESASRKRSVTRPEVAVK